MSTIANFSQTVKTGSAAYVEDLILKWYKQNPSDWSDFLKNKTAKTTLLSEVVKLANVPLLQIIIQYSDFLNIDLNDFNEDGFTVLHQCVLSNNLEMIEVLLKTPQKIPTQGTHNSVNINIQCKNEIYNGYTALHFAALRNYGDIGDVLLHQYEANPEIFTREDLRSPLHVACANIVSTDFFVRLLLEKVRTKLDPASFKKYLNMGDSTGYTALILAIGKSNVDNALYLIEQGADVNQCDANKDYPLHHAFHIQLQRVFHGNWQILPNSEYVAFQLVRAGARIDVVNCDNTSALYYACDPLKVILQVFSESAECRDLLPDLDDIANLIDPNNEGKYNAISETHRNALIKAFPALKQHQIEALEEEEKRGPCTLISAKGSKSGSSGCPVFHGEEETWVPSDSDSEAEYDDASDNDEDGESQADSSAAAKCPFMSGNMGKSANIPNPHGPSPPKTAPKKEQPKAKEGQSGQVPVEAKSEGGKCPIPFHKQLMDPNFWMGAATVGVVAAGVFLLKSRMK
eukprot:CAMPEP_0168568702 /NCGR_PEP_ID=MMETSP0413-20121227/15722_1 /TAXON_ID=136452 /ORGANISM="Filamoeba nolandi, Strain NC-AS-23-1" /LENGTH=515 /DNA_ID=CAMNT_0008601063 /DNA_START=78 /DNA_END=1625 /DNA_ORIENTATION=-